MGWFLTAAGLVVFAVLAVFLAGAVHKIDEDLKSL